MATTGIQLTQRFVAGNHALRGVCCLRNSLTILGKTE